MFSKTCEYAIRAMIFIAQKSKDGSKIGIKEIAKGIDSPEYFIAKILQDLSRKGVVQSQKGPTGGFYLENSSRKTSLATIVKAVDGDSIFSGCGLGLKQCSDKHPCPLHHEFLKIRKDITDMLNKTRLGDLQEELDQQLTFLRRN
ncbi:RrF2 family transcriptional regulator [Chitinophaga rhizophila]|uniref:Rrf2 family transcriptional regulator n=1 Tax=Chitinophaga rhizophila TaxID=2866212 RepID=A0ABS7GA51_9BACT|nr:Rrf2 family transcriptional regulator [Chitinophaga rhizophila]MBW8684536.1 Rrf2 family transcriptional regulator [Chitinophaga rhizophila]